MCSDGLWSQYPGPLLNSWDELGPFMKNLSSKYVICFELFSLYMVSN